MAIGILTTVLLAAGGAVGRAATTDDETPKTLGLVERAGSRLVQLDVSVRGPEEVLSGLTADDFELRVGGRLIENLFVDRVCRTIETSDPAGVVADDALSTAAGSFLPAPGVAPATFLFYIDQPLLTMPGRQETIETIRVLIPRLFEGQKSQGILVYNGRDLDVVTDMTSDPDVLLEALAAVEGNRTNWDSYAMEELNRIEELAETIESFGTDIGLSQARIYQREEAWRAERSLRRLSMTLGRLAEYEQPKAVVYFADILRRNPGKHFLDLFPNQMLMPTEQIGTQTVIAASSEFGESSFDRLIDEASALGIRFYTVQAEGLWADTVSARRPQSGSNTGAGKTRIRDAQDALDSIGLETGGRSFLNGIPPKKIATHLLEDLTCLVLVSFEPGDLPLDEPLPVRLKTTVPKIGIHTRGRLVIQSEPERQRTRLMAAFATAGRNTAVGGSPEIRGKIIPTEFRDGKWSALVQVWVPGTSVHGATWDVGASLVARGKVREDFAERVLASSPGARVVPPGPYELVVVAPEVTTDQVFSRKFEGAWPDPNEQPAAVGPIAVLQPEIGAFLRDGQTRNRGALALGGTDVVRTDRPTALIALVCRAKNNRRPLTLERSLSGENEVSFDPVTIPSEERCLQIRDGVPAGALGAGELEYRVRVIENGVEIARGESRILAVDAGSKDAASLGERP